MSLQRPELDELLSLVREGDTVLVARFFRLGRSRDHVIHLVNSFHQRNIQFKALNLGIDTSPPAGKFMRSIFASLAEYDRESIPEKTKAGQQLAAAQGKHIGRPKGLRAFSSPRCYKEARNLLYGPSMLTTAKNPLVAGESIQGVSC